MKKARKLAVGSVVSVPDYCFAPNRQGWNGWVFRVGIVREVGTSKKNGERIYKVESSTLDYGRTKDVRTRWMYGSAIFDAELDIWDAKRVTEYPREHWCNGYSGDVEFLIDNGIIEDNFKSTQG